MSTSTSHANGFGNPRRVRRGSNLRLAALAIACAALTTGCPLGMHGAPSGLAGAQALATAQPPLAWTVNAAQATRTLPVSAVQEKEAAPGSRFLVLDVSVKNRDVEPQVLSEGKLIAMDESSLQTFDTPVTVLSDDYLSLQVLEPEQRLRGKIAYEVPEHLPGVLYWSPGDGSRRILLNVLAEPGAQRTLANAATGEDDVDPSGGSAIKATPPAPVIAQSAAATPTPTKREVARAEATRSIERVGAPERDEHPTVVTAPPRPPMPADIAMATPAAIHGDALRPPATATTVAPASEAPTVYLPVNASPTVYATPYSTVVASAGVSPRPTAAQQTIAREQARRQQCHALVTRNDPAQKAQHLDYFAQSCRDFALPSSWRPHRSLFSRASDLLARVPKPRLWRVSDCTAGTHADRLVCADAHLSAMEQQLAQSVARAHAQTDDPNGLLRSQDVWRGSVRNACSTINCLEHAYGRRIAQLEAIRP